MNDLNNKNKQIFYLNNLLTKNYLNSIINTNEQNNQQIDQEEFENNNEILTNKYCLNIDTNDVHNQLMLNSSDSNNNRKNNNNSSSSASSQKSLVSPPLASSTSVSTSTATSDASSHTNTLQKVIILGKEIIKLPIFLEKEIKIKKNYDELGEFIYYYLNC